MRTGLALSSLLHVSLIGFGLFTLAGQKLDHDPLDIESIAIDLVPISDEMALREGNKQAAREAAPAPKPTQKPEVNNQARHVGDGQVDSAAPLDPRQKAREVEAPPPTASAPPAAPPVTPPDTPESKEPEQATLPVQEPQEAPQPPQPPQQAVLAAEEEPQPLPSTPEQAVATAPVIPPLPQHAPQPKQKPQKPQKPESQVAQQQTAHRQENLDDLLEQSAALIDRTPTQGGGMRRATEPAGAGASRSIGDNQRLAQTIQNVIGACIKDKARITALSGSRSNNLVVKVHMRLNPDGSIDGVPDLTPSGGEASEREIAVTQGFAALARCTPFIGLPPERYDDGWRDVILNWRPLD